MQDLEAFNQSQQGFSQPRFTGRMWSLPQQQPQQQFGGLDFGAPAGRLPDSGQPAIDPEEESGPGFLGTVGDIALAPVRGAETFLREAYGAVDFLALDSLPDWDRNALTGSSETAVGGFIESATSFAIGFAIPFGLLGKGAGFLSKANQASKVTKLGKFGIETARASAAGAISDFTLYDHQEARLAQLKEQFPDAAAPLDAYMAEEIGDSELVGRLKQVATGAVFGVAADGLLYGVRALRAARKAAKAGASAEQVLKAAQDANAGQKIPGVEPLEPPTAEQRMRARGAIDGYLAGDLLDVQRNPRAPAPEAGTLPTEAVSSGGVADARQTNLERYKTPEEGLKFLRGMELETLDLLRKDPNIIEQTANRMFGEGQDAYQALLTKIGATESEHTKIALALAEKIGQSTDAVTEARAIATAGAMFVDSELQRLHPALKALRDNLDPDALRDLEEQTVALQGVILRMRGYSAETARSLRLQAFQLPDLKSIPADKLRERVELLIDATDPTKPMAIKPLTAMDKFWGVTNELWINSILSGMRTMSVTALSATSLTIYNPIERMLGAAVRAVSEKDLGILTEAYRYNRDFFRSPKIAAGIKRDAGQVMGVLDEFRGIALSTLEATKFAAKSFRDGPLLTPQATATEFAQGAVSSSFLGLNKDSMVGRFVDMAGKVVRTPTKAMGSIDEFFKQINGRGIAKAELYRKARALGIDDANIDAYVYDRMESLIVNGRLATEADMAKRLKAEMAEMSFATAEEKVKFQTEWWGRNFNKSDQTLLERVTDATDQVNMTAQLRPGTLSSTIQNATLKHPYLRIVVPFIRTPTNLLNWTIRDRGLGAAKGLGEWMSKARFDPEKAKALRESHNLTLRDLASGDSIRQSEAYGRVAAAASFVTAASFFAASDSSTTDILSGQGPTNPAMRKAWLQAGYQPYSIRIGDEWVSYARLDPFASAIGMIADLVTISKWAPESDQNMVEEGLATVIAALAHNFTNKSYFQGITDFLEVVTQPNEMGPKWISRMAGNVIPNLLAQGVQTYDPVMRDAQGVFERILSRTPAYGSLDPQRNVLGEVITRNEWMGPEYVSPIAFTEVKDDIIFEEMLLLRRAFQPPRHERSGLNLKDYKSASGQSAYDRWMELTGETKLGGLGLRDRLRQLITSPRYQQLSPEEVDGVQSARVRPIKSVLEKYQQHAYFAMLREYPDLDQDLRQKRELRQRSFQPQTAGAPAPQASGTPSQSPLFSLTR